MSNRFRKVNHFYFNPDKLLIISMWAYRSNITRMILMFISKFKSITINNTFHNNVTFQNE